MESCADGSERLCGGATFRCVVSYRSGVQSLPAGFYIDDEIKEKFKVRQDHTRIAWLI